ncbi:Uncharacterised protein [Mycobacteroides abscessus subsp. abscessus]|nr:Uncharacterised protein [Mycobacteroides abscessus subsp. abscessus]
MLHIRIEERCGEKRFTQAPRGEVECHEDVQVIATNRVAQILGAEREGRQQIEAVDQYVPVLRQRANNRVQPFEIGDDVVLGGSEHPIGNLREVAHGAESLDDVRAILVEHLQRGLDRIDCATEAFLVLGQHSGELVDAFDGRDDVVPLRVQRRDQRGKFGQYLGQIAGAPLEQVVRLIGDVL